MSFGKNLQYLRQLSKNMTQEALAERLGLSRSAVGMYERGQREPNLKTLGKIAAFFHVDMNYLLDYTGRVLEPSQESGDFLQKSLLLRPQFRNRSFPSHGEALPLSDPNAIRSSRPAVLEM